MYRLLPQLLAATTILSLLAGCATGPNLAGSEPLASPDGSAQPLAETSPDEASVDPEPGTEPNPEGVPESDGDTSVGPPAPNKRQGPGKLTIRLKSQRFEYREGGALILAGEISSGSPAHPTPRGKFKVLSKNKDKRSGSYTNYFDSPTPMPYAIQFNGPYYLHEGWLPGHADSHGCVRLHYDDARFVFERIRVGDPVTVVN